MVVVQPVQNEKPTLYITVGLPGSGKTTWAKKFLRDHPGTVRVNRDDLREMLHSSVWSAENEALTTAVRDDIIVRALRKGRSVICDDTNLSPKVRTRLQFLADRNNAQWQLYDLTGVPLETCLERDAARTKPVGEVIIKGMYAQFTKEHARWSPQSSKPLVCLGTPLEDQENMDQHPSAPSPIPVPLTPLGPLAHAVICDIDGTIARSNGRGWFDWHRVGEDLPRSEVIDVVRAASRDKLLIFVSGRSDVCRAETSDWLKTQGFINPVLLMRKQGDNRRDSVIKRELYDTLIGPFYKVVAVFDDRPQVINECWRPLGLTVFDVGDGREF